MRCLWGATLSANEKGKTGTEAVAALLGIVFLSTAALLAAVQEVGRTQPEFVWLYVFATAIPLIVMGTVLQTAHRTRKRRSDKKCHFFDVGTVRFTRSVLAMSFILWGVSSYLGFVGLLPGQPERQIKYFSIHEVTVHTFDDKSGLKAFAKLDENVYPQGIPPQIAIKICRHDSLDDWSVSQIRIVGLVRKEGKQERKGVYRTRPADPALYEYEVLWPRPPTDKEIEAYELEVELRPIAGITEKEIASAKQLIMDGKGLTVFNPRLQQ